MPHSLALLNYSHTKKICIFPLLSPGICCLFPFHSDFVWFHFVLVFLLLLFFVFLFFSKIGWNFTHLFLVCKKTILIVSSKPIIKIGYFLFFGLFWYIKVSK
eukprot:Phypoly_transcript_22538.p1 GENE.Phypoly_transcript_22538~~Phypoly_transcript_22538.p1  ORF type:complete len:102 (-),score=4.82 Phypoly_transcript_22538:108-413(-)